MLLDLDFDVPEPKQNVVKTQFQLEQELIEIEYILKRQKKLIDDMEADIKRKDMRIIQLETALKTEEGRIRKFQMKELNDLEKYKKLEEKCFRLERDKINQVPENKFITNINNKSFVIIRV